MRGNVHVRFGGRGLENRAVETSLRRRPPTLHLAYGDDAANVLFHVVNDRHLRMRSMIFTTNKRLKDWGRVLHDEDLAAAIVDRILERGRLLSLDGPSMRTRHVSLDDPGVTEALTEPAIISGIDRQEFPEPTRFADHL